MFNWLKRIFRNKNIRKTMNVPPYRSFRTGIRLENVVSVSTSLSTSPIEPDLREEADSPDTIIQLLETGVEINTENINQKLDILEARALLYSSTLSRGVPEELWQAIEVLKVRKKYPKIAHLFTWKTTTKERIDKLTTKYKLMHRPISVYIGDLPEEAVKEVAEFKNLVEAHKVKSEIEGISLSIIAPPEQFRTPKGDPILLAKSPFGDFYYVLGAWDKEVDLVGELLA